MTSPLETFISSYGVDKLAVDLKALGAKSPGWRFFNLLWSEPKDILSACTMLGFTTPEEVVAGVTAINNVVGTKIEVIEQLIDPPTNIKITETPAVTFDVIHGAVAKNALLREDFFVDQSDRTYHLPTKAEWVQLAATCPIHKRTWVAETMDCDDFVRAFLGWLAFKGLGNLAAGFCALSIYGYDDKLIGGHAVALVMDSEKNVWFLDPQESKLYPVSYARFGGNILAKSVKIARLYF